MVLPSCGSVALTPASPEPGQVADETQAAHVIAKGQAVAPQHPDHSHQAHAGQGVHYGGGGILPAHQAAVEEGQARRHQQYQG